MLPAEYSEGTCSLLPNKTSYGLSLQFLWNGTRISDCSWFESVFVTQHSYTYDSFRETAPSSLSRVVQDVASFLAGRVVDDPHEWVEQWMLYYNQQAGQVLKTAQMGILRRHPPADRERWERYRVNLPEWKHLAMSSATYCLAEEEDTYHHGLETDGYAHTTSPIRRYADLVNQRALKQYLHGGVSRFIVPVTMYEMNRREKVIKQFAREMTFLEALRTGHTIARAVVLEKETSEGECRVRFYVPEWKKTVAATYPLSPDGAILSRDGRTPMKLCEFSTVTLQCSSYAAQRHPKKRMLFQVLGDDLPHGAHDLPHGVRGQDAPFGAHDQDHKENH
jgi:exoribonuclease R